jgi:hypothetical protein
MAKKTIEGYDSEVIRNQFIDLVAFNQWQMCEMKSNYLNSYIGYLEKNGFEVIHKYNAKSDEAKSIIKKNAAAVREDEQALFEEYIGAWKVIYDMCNVPQTDSDYVRERHRQATEARQFIRGPKMGGFNTIANALNINSYPLFVEFKDYFIDPKKMDQYYACLKILMDRDSQESLARSIASKNLHSEITRNVAFRILTAHQLLESIGFDLLNIEDAYALPKRAEMVPLTDEKKRGEMLGQLTVRKELQGKEKEAISVKDFVDDVLGFFEKIGGKELFTSKRYQYRDETGTKRQCTSRKLNDDYIKKIIERVAYQRDNTIDIRYYMKLGLVQEDDDGYMEECDE